MINPGRVANDSINLTRQHFYLLGLVRGHWEKYESELGDFDHGERDSLNTGIAIVTPIQKALDIIDSEEEVKRRRQIDRQEMEKER